MENENRLRQLDRLEEVEEVEKATETAMRQAEQEADQVTYVRPLIYKVGSHCRVIGKLPNSWKQTYLEPSEWEKDLTDTQRRVFDSQCDPNGSVIFDSHRRRSRRMLRRKRDEGHEG